MDYIQSSFKYALTMFLLSSFFLRIVQIVLEQSSDKDYLMARAIRIYVPYWISFARLPPINLQLIDISGRKDKRRFLARPRSERSEKILYEINHEELVEGYTIASGLNFKGLGLSASACRHGSGQFGLLKELSPLGDMVHFDFLNSSSPSLVHCFILKMFLLSLQDGAVDISAYDDDGKCTHILLCSKPSSYQAVPTKVTAC